MANMMDYLDWRGDLTFTASGFNEVDNLLFAELVYTSFDGIVTGQSEAEAVTLAEASAVFWEQNSREEILAAAGTVPGLTNLTVTEEKGGEVSFTAVSESGADLRGALSLALAKAGCPVLNLRAESMSLEDVFLELEGEKNA